ncbi:unnamed protein product [Cochlearia groenlandica]
MKNLSIFLIVFGLCIIGKVYSAHDCQVKIKNELDPKHKHTTLFVHCKSGDKDLGRKYVELGKIFQFPVEVNLLGTTLFWCTLRHGANYRFIKRFDVYKYTSKIAQGSTYIWAAKENGIYKSLVSSKTEPLTFAHAWEKFKPVKAKAL